MRTLLYRRRQSCGEPRGEAARAQAPRESPSGKTMCRSHPNLFSSCFVLTLRLCASAQGEGHAGQGLALTDRAVGRPARTLPSWQETGQRAGRGETQPSLAKKPCSSSQPKGQRASPTPPHPHCPLLGPSASCCWEAQMLPLGVHPRIHTDATLPRPPPSQR